MSCPTDVVKQATDTLGGWQKITPAFPVGDITATSMAADIDKVQPLLLQVSVVDAQLTDLRNQRDALYDGLWDKVKRIRNAVKGNFGDDSSEYEMVGGTRLSEHKPRARKPPKSSKSAS